MKPELEQQINDTLAMARKHGITISEVWIGPSDFILSDYTPDGDKLFWNGIRVRKMADDQIPRVGETTCGLGPGVT